MTNSYFYEGAAPSSHSPLAVHCADDLAQLPAVSLALCRSPQRYVPRELHPPFIPRLAPCYATKRVRLETRHNGRREARAGQRPSPCVNRRFLKKITTLIYAALLALSHSQLYATDLPEPARNLAHEIYDYTYGQIIGSAPDADADAIITGFEPWFRRAQQFPAESVEYLYLSAFLNRILFSALGSIDGDLAAEHWRLAFEFGRRAAQKEGDYADVYALFAAISGQSFQVIGSEGLAYVELTDKMIKRALQLDGKNALAWETQGFFFLFTPRGYGGDAKKAVKAFQKAAESDINYIRLWAQVWLSAAYFENGRAQEARVLISKTLSEAPHQPYIRFARDQIYNNKNPLFQSFTLE